MNAFPENAAAKISVKDVKITNAYKNGTTTPAATENAANWTATEPNLVVAFAPAGQGLTGLVAGTGKGETEHMYLIPTAKGEAYIVTFTVTLDQNGATTDYNHSVTINTTQVKGNSYNYIANIDASNINPDPNAQLYPIEFTATVKDWNGFNDTEVLSPVPAPGN